MSLKELSEGTENLESLALRKVVEIWSEGNIFHVFRRWITKRDGERVDRLSEILKRGLIPPLLDPEDIVTSDLRLEVKGTSRSYNSVVFLHRFDQTSYLYIPRSPDSMCIFIDQEFPVLTIDQMEENWPKLSQDEVYSIDPISPEKFNGLSVSDQLAEEIREEFQDDLLRLSIPLYGFSGNSYWPRRV